MAHYAILNKENVVTEVIVGKDENEPLPEGYSSWEEYYGGKRTSYNTLGGKHLFGGTPFRKNYAGKNYTYDEVLDAFIPPKPFDSWTINQETGLWEAPIPMPVHAENEKCTWLEADQMWDIQPIN